MIQAYLSKLSHDVQSTGCGKNLHVNPRAPWRMRSSAPALGHGAMEWPEPHLNRDWRSRWGLGPAGLRHWTSVVAVYQAPENSADRELGYFMLLVSAYVSFDCGSATAWRSGVWPRIYLGTVLYLFVRTVCKLKGGRIQALHAKKLSKLKT